MQFSTAAIVAFISLAASASAYAYADYDDIYARDIYARDAFPEYEAEIYARDAYAEAYAEAYADAYSDIMARSPTPPAGTAPKPRRRPSAAQKLATKERNQEGKVQANQAEIKKLEAQDGRIDSNLGAEMVSGPRRR